MALALLAVPAPALAASASDALVGKPAPAFTLLGDTGKPVSLAEFAGHPVVLAFFPQAFTGG